MDQLPTTQTQLIAWTKTKKPMRPLYQFRGQFVYTVYWAVWAMNLYQITCTTVTFKDLVCSFWNPSLRWFYSANQYDKPVAYWLFTSDVFLHIALFYFILSFLFALLIWLIRPNWKKRRPINAVNNSRNQSLFSKRKKAYSLRIYVTLMTKSIPYVFPWPYWHGHGIGEMIQINGHILFGYVTNVWWQKQ